ncbi:outer membrane scaffolding protein for murein synthesis (MipA/OmpV family) [Phyllobacterium leguminum]|uniref:Outer membrane scaffolding protein for murein synthesis (MipA/OmpV family) n=1 Tax=Phyllobacterium leguminum TaxID=314237 RepID=A0A318T791_9HYPH|nr:MipA/OmpV family protein [Phyllobacterium leguminum]PYE90410.1 outer membrane scaffolding protein for murein synthesis (MipA/OmpV family) [Phyllobacterium leguminum]
MRISSFGVLSGAVLFANFASAADLSSASDPVPAVEVQEPRKHFWSGDWYLTVGAAGFAAPRFEGSSSRVFSGTPMISLGRAGSTTRFSSRIDNPSFALIDNDRFRAGINGKLLFERDGDTADELKGLDPVRFGGELGGFAEVYPTDWLRLRAEVRQGIRAHKGVVGEVAADAFFDVTPTIRVSGGPRASFATKEYFEAYYGVDAEAAVASGLSQYSPGGGFKSAGVGGAITWKTTEKVTTSLFAEYARLQGPAADSSLVKERGSRDQFTFGASATYRFDFSL